MSALVERREGGVLHLVLNRPERRNALNPEMMTGLLDALGRAIDDASVRAILLTGAGGHFCVGGDVKAFAEQGGAGGDAPLEARAANLRARMEAARLLHQMAKPTICGLSGSAAGAGLSLALACDLRVVGASAKVTTAFAKVGLSGDFGGSYFLSQIVGLAKARELYILSPVLDASACERLGIANRVVADGDVDAQAMALAQELADGPTITLSYIKKNFQIVSRGDLGLLLDAEALHHSRCGQTADHKEASAAFVAKRKPHFKGA
jgi:2-(1,2-epoxy-1,2-dihydrophenyl)acetyl-CoA isomerase